MNEPNAQLDRIEQLLREGNELRREAIALQQQALAGQLSLVDEHRAIIAKAAQVNDGALALQQRSRRIVTALIPILVVLIGYASWLLFFMHDQ